MKGRKPGLDTIRRRLPADPGPAPACPDWLDAVGRAEWERIAPELQAVSALDATTLALYCDAVSELRKVRESLDRDGRTWVDEKGHPKAHPLTNRHAALLQQIRQYAEHFGLTPASRSRINAPPAPSAADDEFDAL